MEIEADVSWEKYRQILSSEKTHKKLFKNILATAFLWSKDSSESTDFKERFGDNSTVQCFVPVYQSKSSDIETVFSIGDVVQPNIPVTLV